MTFSIDVCFCREDVERMTFVLDFYLQHFQQQEPLVKQELIRGLKVHSTFRKKKPNTTSIDNVWSWFVGDHGEVRCIDSITEELGNSLESPTCS
jgi:hypothetical protein